MMKKLTYLAVFEKTENGGYSVYFPDLPGCIGCGNKCC
jgi:predicted RNase H-like HicB family nuclease